MVQAWYLNKETSDHRDPPEYIDVKDLYKRTGVEYFQLNPDTCATDGVIEKIKAEKGYVYEDEMVCSEESPDFEERVESFKTEHLHSDEEIRLFLDGRGYFDVRDAQDQWIRIEVTAGDMIVLPAGIYHRFTLCPKKYVSMKRFFSEMPKWVAYNRPADDMACRKQYVDKLTKEFPQVC